MKLLLKISLLLFTGYGFPTIIHAQQFTIDSSNKSIDIQGNFNGAAINLPAVAKQPEFPGSKKEWQQFLLSNINVKIPFTNKAIPGTYKIIIRFTVNLHGKLLGIGAESNCGYGMESEVIRCISKSPDWIPAETSTGKKVNFTLRTIVIFNVKRNDIIVNFL